MTQVLFHEPENVKGLVRRGLAYEGLEKYSKAAADMREALSIEYSLGGDFSSQKSLLVRV